MLLLLLFVIKVQLQSSTNSILIYHLWVLRQNKSYIQSDLFERVKIRLPGVESGLITGYAVCLFFADKVC